MFELFIQPPAPPQPAQNIDDQPVNVVEFALLALHAHDHQPNSQDNHATSTAHQFAH
jgi:hypothetical protein